MSSSTFLRSSFQIAAWARTIWPPKLASDFRLDEEDFGLGFGTPDLADVRQSPHKRVQLRQVDDVSRKIGCRGLVRSSRRQSHRSAGEPFGSVVRR